MTCPTYPTFRASLEASAQRARLESTAPEKFPPFQQSLALARYHRETCPECLEEIVAAFPELAGKHLVNDILSYKIVEEVD